MIWDILWAYMKWLVFGLPGALYRLLYVLLVPYKVRHRRWQKRQAKHGLKPVGHHGTP